MGDRGNASGAPKEGQDPSAALNDNGAGSADAGGSAYKGSPLCRVDSTSCLPDDDGRGRSHGVVPCADPADASTGDAGAAPNGCRLLRGYDGIKPECKSGTPTGLDGEVCAKGSDCAPGFDCVSDAKQGGLCRRYCCLGTCASQVARSGGKTFCDVQKLVDPEHNAPVCVPLKGCTLLSPNECPASETCAVVTEDGDTGCVGAGSALAGASCDEEHCAAGLTCLGQPGFRKCYELCRVGEPCKGGQVCQTSTVFKDAAFGVCQKSP